ncbi:hypothetical protein HDV06_002766 [Boothiomyces sp. JEL0866]|nr:hypothetical protein HDV06_002766 [Boothiomyces sp. JEL0866]
MEMADKSDLYEKITINGHQIQSGATLKAIRLIALILYIVIDTLWCTIGILLIILGLKTHLENYKLFRRGFYLLFAFIALFISFPVVNYFGNTVMTAITSHHSKKDTKTDTSDIGHADRSAKEDAKSTEESNQNPIPPSKRVTDIQAKNKALGTLLKNISYWLYFYSAFAMLAIVVVFECFSLPITQLVTKIIVDLYIWSSSAFLLHYLIYRYRHTPVVVLSR